MLIITELGAVLGRVDGASGGGDDMVSVFMAWGGNADEAME